MNLLAIFEVLGSLFKDIFTPTTDSIEMIHSMGLFMGMFFGIILISWIIVFHSPITPYIKPYITID